jgi:hypothetical protein
VPWSRGAVVAGCRARESCPLRYRTYLRIVLGSIRCELLGKLRPDDDGLVPQQETFAPLQMSLPASTVGECPDNNKNRRSFTGPSG